MSTFWLATTFPNTAWALYAQESLAALTRHLPPACRFFVGLDDAALAGAVQGLLRAQDVVLVGMQPDHAAFVQENKHRDHAQDYRLQAVRFCHKVFVLRHVLSRALAEPESLRPEFLLWWDADAILNRAVTEAELLALCPRGDETCSYLGRKDWDHSEAGFIGFNIANGGAEKILSFMHTYYTQGFVYSLPQWHDSYLFDVARGDLPARNLSAGVAGNNVWAGTALASFSEHRKGHEAKARGRALTDKELFGR